MIGGYEPKSADAFFKRTGREYARFGETWGLQTNIGLTTVSDDGHIATAEIETAGAGWQVSTTFNFLIWNELVLEDFSRPVLVRLLRYFITFWDYVLSGSMFSFIRANWRFALYFLFPAVMLVIIITVSALTVLYFKSTELPGNPASSLILGIVLLGLLWWRFHKHLLHLMDLWSFSRYYLRDNRPDADARITRYAEAIVVAVKSNKFDEIVLIGHSTGGALILDIAATTLAINPQFADGNCRISILTIGSTALKIGLHPSAHTFRSKVQTLVDHSRIDWAEYQCRTDVINFYKTDPVGEMGLVNNRTDEFPIVRRVRIRDMLEPEVYARVKRNFFRVHYQFIMANTKAYYYDFFMFCCAPVYLRQRATDRVVGAMTKQSGTPN